jgi:hypothetical protein
MGTPSVSVAMKSNSDRPMNCCGAPGVDDPLRDHGEAMVAVGLPDPVGGQAHEIHVAVEHGARIVAGRWRGMIGDHVQDAAEPGHFALGIEDRRQAHLHDARRGPDLEALLAIDGVAPDGAFFRRLADGEQFSDLALLGLQFGDAAETGIAPFDRAVAIGQEQGRPGIHQFLLENVAKLLVLYRPFSGCQSETMFFACIIRRSSPSARRLRRRTGSRPDIPGRDASRSGPSAPVRMPRHRNR